MAGMLAGVETARVRRIHQRHAMSAFGIGIGSSQSRRFSFSFFSVSSENGEVDDEKLGKEAREAKQRLDERLRAPKALLRRNNSDLSRPRRAERKEREVRTEVYGTSKTKKRQEEECMCVVCLEEFRMGENVVRLPCSHTFHSRCMLPWLPTNPLCPCCRAPIFP